jgi:hypothetical protein
LHAGNHAANSGCNDGVGARPGTALMRAGFEIDVQNSTPSFFSRLLQSQDFSVFDPGEGVGASANDLSRAVHNHRTNTGVGRGQTDSCPRQLK